MFRVVRDVISSVKIDSMVVGLFFMLLVLRIDLFWCLKLCSVGVSVGFGVEVGNGVEVGWFCSGCVFSELGVCN